MSHMLHVWGHILMYWSIYVCGCASVLGFFSSACATCVTDVWGSRAARLNACMIANVCVTFCHWLQARRDGNDPRAVRRLVTGALSSPAASRTSLTWDVLTNVFDGSIIWVKCQKYPWWPCLSTSTEQGVGGCLLPKRAPFYLIFIPVLTCVMWQRLSIIINTLLTC